MFRSAKFIIWPVGAKVVKAEVAQAAMTVNMFAQRGYMGGYPGMPIHQPAVWYCVKCQSTNTGPSFCESCGEMKPALQAPTGYANVAAPQPLMGLPNQPTANPAIWTCVCEAQNPMILARCKKCDLEKARLDKMMQEEQLEAQTTV
jgi:hypothetical protein